MDKVLFVAIYMPVYFMFTVVAAVLTGVFRGFLEFIVGIKTSIESSVYKLMAHTPFGKDVNHFFYSPIGGLAAILITFASVWTPFGIFFYLFSKYKPTPTPLNVGVLLSAVALGIICTLLLGTTLQDSAKFKHSEGDIPIRGHPE